MAELAEAAPVPVEEVQRLLERGLLRAGPDGRFAVSDIQRVRAVKAMMSPGFSLDELYPAFEAGYFTLEPIEMLFPEPSAATSQTFSELAHEMGLGLEAVSRVFIAAGFPSPRPDDLVRVDDAHLVRELVRAGTLFGGPELAVRTARILGDATRRAAEAGLALFEEGDQMRSAAHREAMSDPHRRDEMNQRGGELMRLAEELIGALFRRHLEHGLMRVWAGAAEAWLDQLGIRAAASRLPGLVFVDLAGFTALTEQAGDATAARLATDLADLAEHAAAAHRGRVVKLLGDGAMLFFDEPVAAVRGAVQLVGHIGQAGLPAARGGVHAGPVIERDGDYFGRTVNLAARIAAHASPGQVLVSEEVVALARPTIEFERIGSRELKGVGSVSLHAAMAAVG